MLKHTFKCLFFTKTQSVVQGTLRVINSRLTSTCLGKVDRKCQFTGFRLLTTSTEDFTTDLEPGLTYFDEIIDERKSDFRLTLYENNHSEAISLINEAKSLEELKRQLEKLSDRDLCEPSTICQSVLVLWDIIRIVTESGDEPSSFQGTDFLSTAIMQNVLLNVSEKAHNFSFNELGCLLLYLQKIGMSIRDPVLQTVTNTFLQMAESQKEAITLPALSRFVVAFYKEGGLYSLLTCIDVLPKIYEFLDNVQTPEDLRLVIIALDHVVRLITDEKLQHFCSRMEEFIAKEMVDPQSALKALNFLNYPDWSNTNASLKRKLVLILEPFIETLHKRDLIMLQRIIKNQLEPFNMVPMIVARADSLLESSKSADLLLCSLFETTQTKKSVLTKTAEELVAGGTENLAQLFKVLRLLKTSNTALIDSYWSKVVNDIKNDEKYGNKVFQHMQRYMHFNNNLAGSYRHSGLEKTVTEIMFKDIQTGISSMLPSAFARAASFVVAYEQNVFRDHSMAEFLLEKIEAMAKQFRPQDCLKLSQGIFLANDLRYKYFIPTQEAPYLLKIEEVLNACAARHAKTASVENINVVVKAYNARRSSRKSALFTEMMSSFDRLSDIEMSSRTVRDFCFNLSTSNYFCPNILDHCIHYVQSNSTYVSGETLEKLISTCFGLGYVPEKPEFFACCTEILDRNFNFMSGLSIIQACLSLCFFKALELSLVERIFNINFIKRLEEEIESCYSKEKYPGKVLNSVMQLNRAVCLDMPEANVPWFQQNYIEAQMSKTSSRETKFSLDVKSHILSIIQSDHLVKTNHVTPYGYKIEFVLHKLRGKVIQPMENPRPEVEKLAVVILRTESFCENNLKRLKGYDLLKKRHLEILGYKVIHVNFREWNSMYLSIPGARTAYLKELLGLS